MLFGCRAISVANTRLRLGGHTRFAALQGRLERGGGASEALLDEFRSFDQHGNALVWAESVQGKQRSSDHECVRLALEEREWLF